MRFIKETMMGICFLSLLLSAALKSDHPITHEAHHSPLKDTCYIKAIMPDRFESTWIRLPIYTGSDTDVELLEYKRTTGEAKTRWVTKVDKNCVSDNPDDCTVYCFEAFDVETETIMYLADTVFTKAFEYKYIENRVLTARGGNYDYQPAICSDAVNQVLVSKICYKLASQGYIARAQCKGELDEYFATGLNEYQKDNNLPIGGLNLETLDKLKVRY